MSFTTNNVNRKHKGECFSFKTFANDEKLFDIFMTQIENDRITT